MPDADAIAFRLELPRLVLRQAADAYAHARGRAARGRVLVGVLDQLGADACLLDRILAAGVCAGCWGTVTRWDRASRARAVRCSRGPAHPPDEPSSPAAALRILPRARPARGCADRADRGEDPASVSATKPTDLRAAFGCHAVPFTREITPDQLLRLPFLDEALAGVHAAVEALMSAAVIAPAGTALLRRLRDALPDARYHVHYVKVTGLSKRDMCREIAVACGA